MRHVALCGAIHPTLHKWWAAPTLPDYVSRRWNRLRIDDPTPEQIGHHLRHVPGDAPFVILDADNEQFIQATPEGGLFRVEWRQEARHRFMLVSIGRAEESFLAFRRWDQPALKSFPWQRLSVFNDPYRRMIIAVLISAAIALVCLYLALQ